MKFKKLSQKPWYNGAVIACIGVAFYVLLTHFGSVLSALSGFLRNFRVIILGIVFAYVMNPLANFFSNKVLRKMKNGSRRWTMSVLLTVVTALLALLFLIGTLIPQLVTSVAAFSENIDGYADSAIRLLEGSFLERFLDADRITTLSQNALNSIISFVQENAGRILSSAANSGKNVISAVISLILLSWRFISGLLQMSVVLLHCHTMAFARGLPLLSKAIVVSRWFVIPMPAMSVGDRPLFWKASLSA